MRRIEKRMRAIKLSSYADFIQYLEEHPDEFRLLFNAILVNTTAFFRDSAAWQQVVSGAVPQLIAQKAPDEPVRIWSAGGASGEEAYSLAMVFAEALGREQFLKRVKIFGTDIDEEALVQARKASYDARNVSGVPAELLEKYFVARGDRFVFDSELRRALAFGVHDLIRDAPIARIDLVACRNTLMYFNAETQTEVLRRLHVALVGGGTLFLGRAEMLLRHANEFTPIDRKRGLFRKSGRFASATPHTLRRETQQAAKEVAEAAARDHLFESALDASPDALLVLDTRGVVVVASERARARFAIGPNDIGRPLRELEIAHRPVDLGPLIERAYAERRSTTVKDVRHSTASGEAYIDVRIVPLYDAAATLGVVIWFVDATTYRRLQAEVNALTSELDTALWTPEPIGDEVDAVSELPSRLAELEILQAELRSASAQLHSTHRDLKTRSDALKARAADLVGEAAFLNSVLCSFRPGVVVVDSNLVVKLWNRRAEKLWDLRSHEAVGSHLSKLSLRLPIESVTGAIRSCLAGESEYIENVVPLVTRRGRTIRCRITCTPLVLPNEGTGAVLVIEANGA